MHAVAFLCGLALLLAAASRLFHRRTWATVFALALGIGQAAFATTSYPSYFGPNMSFTGIQETSTAGDPEPLFGAPTGSGDALLFFPTTFRASVNGALLSDQTRSQLQTEITATSPGATIDIVSISEFGDFGFGGSGEVGLIRTGQITVLEVNGSAIMPYAIRVPDNWSPDVGTGSWSDSAVVNVASLVPNATKVMLSLDNWLITSTSFFPGPGFATIQKNFVGVSVNQVIPEPSAGLLVIAGLLGLAGRRRRRA